MIKALTGFEIPSNRIFKNISFQESSCSLKVAKCFFLGPLPPLWKRYTSLHVSYKSKFCPSLKVHGTIMPMPEVTEEKFLGDIISSDGKNHKNIKNRLSKGIGISTQIINLLKITSFGSHYFEKAIILRDSMLINGIITNEQEINEFEAIDKLFLKKIFSTPSSIPNDALYLELGILPIGVIVKARRINYLHSLLSIDTNSMVCSFFITQLYNPTRGDWTEQVKKDLVDFDLPIDFDFIQSKSKEAFKKVVKVKAKEYALRKLLNNKSKHSKMNEL